MNRPGAAHVLATLAVRRRGARVIARIANSADNTAHLCGTRSVYEALTPIGKDCAHIGQKSIKRAFGAAKAGLI
jgi:hypothetical protein